MLVAVLATGKSMSQELADSIRGKCPAVAVSNAYLLAPWADALVSNDSNWWRNHPEAFNFKGRRFCGAHLGGTERLLHTMQFPGGCNSGLQGMRVAYEIFKATQIVLLGFDMQGEHFFGQHPPALKNTTPQRFSVFLRQFKAWRGCEVVNCTRGSALTQFRFADLNEVLCT